MAHHQFPNMESDSVRAGRQQCFPDPESYGARVDPRGFYGIGRLVDFCPDPEEPQFMYLAVADIRPFASTVSARRFLKATGLAIDRPWDFRMFAPGFWLISEEHCRIVELMGNLPGGMAEAAALPFSPSDLLSTLDVWPEGLPLSATPAEISARRDRDARLRFETLEAYSPRCAVSDIITMAPDGIRSEVEVCHLWAFAAAGPDIVNNAMPMMRSLHWCFDKGWFGIRRNGDLVLAPQSPNLLRRLLRDRKRISFPKQIQHWPHAECLEWHWNNRFRKTLRELGAADQEFS